MAIRGMSLYLKNISLPIEIIYLFIVFFCVYRPLSTTSNEEFEKNCVRFAHYFTEVIQDGGVWCWAYIFGMDFEVSLRGDGVYVQRRPDQKSKLLNFVEKQSVNLK